MTQLLKMEREQIQNEALKATEGKQKCTIVLGTGVGKTLVGLKHMEKHYSPLQSILIVAPKLSIISSWRYEAEKFGLSKVLENATFSTYLSLNKHNPDEFDAVYFDEVHSLLDSHRSFLDNYVGRVLGLTGTPPKHKNSEKGRIVSEYCPVVFTFKADDAIESGIINDYQIIVHEVGLSTEKNYKVETKNKSFMTSEALNYGYWGTRIDTSAGQTHILRVMRMKAMMEYPSKERYAKELLKSINSKCIVFANTQDQADRMCTHSYHSNNPDSETNLQDFKAGNITKLSCVMQLNEGVNISGLKQGVIMHAYGNERKASQRIGRLLRLNPDDKAIVHILCYIGTVDEKWVKEALEDFDQSKIVWRKYNL
jgi:superfamily II DNA or RNA helicase